MAYSFKPFEDNISLYQGNVKDNDILKYICALLEQPGSDSIVRGEYTNQQNLTIQNGKMKKVPFNEDVFNLLTKLTAYYKPNNKILDVWCVSMKEGDFHMFHNHKIGGTTIAGAYYLKMPDMKPPQGNMNWISNNNVYSYSPKDGDFFVWPSYLQHGVYPFTGSGERIMISWNEK